MRDIPVKPSNTLAERFGNQFRGLDFSQFAEELEPVDSVVEVWPEPPPRGSLHVFVILPGGVGSPSRLRG